MSKKNQIKKFLKKFWFIVWKDESFKGWVISILFIFIMIKFVFFPLLSLITGTAIPLAIVESCSMYHEGNVFSNYELWWDNHKTKYASFQITKEQFQNFGLKRGFSKGDILFIVKAKPEKIAIGDVIILDNGMENPLIHRTMQVQQEKDKYIFSTIGDNNNGQLDSEKKIGQSQLIGKAVFRIMPTLGWGKLIFYEHLKPKNERGFCHER